MLKKASQPRKFFNSETACLENWQGYEMDSHLPAILQFHPSLKILQCARGWTKSPPRPHYDLMRHLYWFLPIVAEADYGRQQLLHSFSEERPPSSPAAANCLVETTLRFTFFPVFVNIHLVLWVLVLFKRRRQARLVQDAPAPLTTCSSQPFLLSCQTSKGGQVVPSGLPERLFFS